MTEPRESSVLDSIRARFDAANERRRERRALAHARQDSSVKLSDSRREAAAPANPKLRRSVVIGASVAAFVVLVLLFMGPGSINTWWTQKSQISALQDKITTLDNANQSLANRSKELQDPQTVEAIARRNYGMVPKNSKAYAILPSADGSDELGGTWPFVDLTRTAPAPK